MRVRTIIFTITFLLAAFFIDSCNPFYPAFTKPDPQSDFYGKWYLDFSDEVHLVTISKNSFHNDRYFIAEDTEKTSYVINNWKQDNYPYILYYASNFSTQGYKLELTRQGSNESLTYYLFLHNGKNYMKIGINDPYNFIYDPYIKQD